MAPWSEYGRVEATEVSAGLSLSGYGTVDGMEMSAGAASGVGGAPTARGAGSWGGCALEESGCWIGSTGVPDAAAFG